MTALLLLIWAGTLGAWTAGLRAGRPADAPLRLNPNTAPPEALALLPGIGPARAEAMAEYREDHVRPVFRGADDLQKVRGIGPKTASAVEAFLSFDPPQVAQDGSEP